MGNEVRYKIYKNIDNDETSLSNNCIIFINEDLDWNILVGTSYGLNIISLFDNNPDKIGKNINNKKIR